MYLSFHKFFATNSRRTVLNRVSRDTSTLCTTSCRKSAFEVEWLARELREPHRNAKGLSANLSGRRTVPTSPDPSAGYDRFAGMELAVLSPKLHTAGVFREVP